MSSFACPSIAVDDITSIRATPAALAAPTAPARKRGLSVQLEPPKKGTAKPAVCISWDGYSSVLDLCKADRRLKGVKSLRSKTGEELTMAELHTFPDNGLVVGSKKPSKLQPEPLLQKPVPEVNNFDPLDLNKRHDPGAPKLSDHAVDQMHLRKIPLSDVTKCIDAGKISERRDNCDLIVLDNITVVQADDGTVVTCYNTVEEIMPCDPTWSNRLRHFMTAIEKEIGGCLIRYDESIRCFLVTGNEVTLDRVRHVIERKGKNFEAEVTVRIPADHDVTVHVIGKGGETIKGIKKRLGLPYLSVNWREASHDLLITSRTALSEEAKLWLYEKVEVIVKEHRPKVPKPFSGNDDDWHAMSIDEQKAWKENEEAERNVARVAASAKKAEKREERAKKAAEREAALPQKVKKANKKRNDLKKAKDKAKLVKSVGEMMSMNSSRKVENDLAREEQKTKTRREKTAAKQESEKQKATSQEALISDLFHAPQKGQAKREKTKK